MVIIVEFVGQPTADSPFQALVATSNPLIQCEQNVLERKLSQAHHLHAGATACIEGDTVSLL